MPTFVLDVFGQKGKRLAVLTIDVDGGGWDFLGGGFNTGGSWEWIFSEETGFFIVLRDKKENIFAFVEANWSKIANPDGHPPRPWFSARGINSGTVSIEVSEPSKVGNWKLRMSNSNGNQDDWRPRR